MIDTAPIAAMISANTGQAAVSVGQRQLAGGDTCSAFQLSLEDGRCYFVKQARPGTGVAGMFQAEARVLERMQAADAIDVPTPVACSDNALVLSWFDTGRPGADWAADLGERLALLHQRSRSERHGFELDTYCGLTRQDNTWTQDWVAFWRDRRLGPQLQRFAARAPRDPLLRAGERLLARLDAHIGEPDEPAVLLHGDLWSGNAAADARGRPIIFDPAGYYGRREAEFGMTRLFGGFGPRFEAAYQAVWPLAPGSDTRIAVYRLYHELNHLNLFGGAYYERCRASLAALA